MLAPLLELEPESGVGAKSRFTIVGPAAFKGDQPRTGKGPPPGRPVGSTGIHTPHERPGRTTSRDHQT